MPALLSRNVVRHTANHYGYELSDGLSQGYDDIFWHAGEKRTVAISYSRGGRYVMSVTVNGRLADIGTGRTQAIRALAGEKVISR